MRSSFPPPSRLLAFFFTSHFVWISRLPLLSHFLIFLFYVTDFCCTDLIGRISPLVSSPNQNSTSDIILFSCRQTDGSQNH
mmetsp:Transcript_1519/g.2731  ORF Transcript_1519/g.2731 Transcript_1519/m.2731 type:complete len:81 (-) Transcript_1519:1856-2098(-)